MMPAGSPSSHKVTTEVNMRKPFEFEVTTNDHFKPGALAGGLRRNFHMKYGNIAANVKQHGLEDADSAVNFVQGMQSVYPEYCLCDPACWICLSSSSH